MDDDHGTNDGLEWQPHIYSPLHPAALFLMQRRQRVIRGIIERFTRNKKKHFSQCALLEIGCGCGQWTLELQQFGLLPQNYSGIELLPEAVDKGMKNHPQADIRSGDASKGLPWCDDSFDVVFQSTVFTSIPDADAKAKIANEMKRVCKSDGLILWYDFICDNPRNPNVKGVGKCEVRELFSPWECRFTSVSLAPPIARRLVPVSWFLAEVVETFMPFLRSHVIAEIKPPR